MTWQETGAFIVQRIVALITGLVIIAMIEPMLVPPDMLPPDVGWFARHAKFLCISGVLAEVGLVFQYWSQNLRKVGWAFLAVTFALVAFG